MVIELEMSGEGLRNLWLCIEFICEFMWIYWVQLLNKFIFVFKKGVHLFEGRRFIWRQAAGQNL